MKIKEELKTITEISTSDFWYDLVQGGYLKPEDILEDPKDIEAVKNAIAVILDFENSCEEQIPGFSQ